MSFLSTVFGAIEPLIPGFVTAGLFLLAIVVVRVMLRHDSIIEKLRLPRSLFFWYIAFLALAAAVRWSWAAAGAALEVLSLFILALAVILALFFALFDLFLGRYRKFHVSAIVRDVLLIIVYVVTIFITLGHRGVNLASILTTSAVLTAVIGFALQDLLSSVIAGLALQVERPFKTGDWVRFEEQEGQILEINWRSTKMQTRHHDIVVIPNNVITRAPVINFSMPTQIHRQHLDLGLRYEAPPNQVKASLLQALGQVEGVLKEPEPFVTLRSYDDFSICYRIFFFLDQFNQRERIEDAVRSRLWYQLSRDGLSIPFPIRDINVRQVSADDEGLHQERQLAEIAALLRKVPVLEPLAPNELRQLARDIKRERFAAGETIIRQGEPGDSFYVIAAGKVRVCIGEQLNEVATLGRDDFFGEMSLMTGQARTATVIAQGDCDLYHIDKRSFHAIIAANESLINEMSHRLEARRNVLSLSRSASDGPLEAAAPGPTPESLVHLIRRFFNLSR